VLEIKKLNAGYGDTQVLWDIDFSIKKGDVVALLGANAAGKSTFINAIFGLVTRISGEIILEGENINDLLPFERVKKGLVQVCEGRRLFPDMKVEENLKLGAYSRRKDINIDKKLEEIYDFLPVLKEKQNQKARNLSGGQQQMVAIGRALMAEPKLLVLDEPSQGLAPVLVQDVFNTIEKIKLQDVTVILVEQNVMKALRIADIGYVLESGRITLKGNANELLADDSLRRAYMGI